MRPASKAVQSIRWPDPPNPRKLEFGMSILRRDLNGFVCSIALLLVVPGTVPALRPHLINRWTLGHGSVPTERREPDAGALRLTIAMMDESPPQPPIETENETTETSVAVPKLLAMTWGTGQNPSEGDLPLWKPDGMKFTDVEAKVLRAEAGNTDFLRWRQASESRPLVLIFDPGPDLPIHTVVQTTCRLPSGRIATSGSSLGLREGKQNPSLKFALSSNTISFRRGQRERWPEHIDVIIKYPVEHPKIIKVMHQAPPLFVPQEIAEGLSWSLELVDDPTQKDADGKPRRLLAGVLRKRYQRGDELIKYGVKVFSKTRDKHLGTRKSELKTIDGQAYQVDTSDSITFVSEIVRVEVTRQRFVKSVIRDVSVRTDLMPVLSTD